MQMPCYNSIMADRHAQEEDNWDRFYGALDHESKPIYEMKVEDFIDLLDTRDNDRVLEMISEIAAKRLRENAQ